MDNGQRMGTEAQAKVVASVWGAKFVQFLAVLAVLPRSIRKKRLNFNCFFQIDCIIAKHFRIQRGVFPVIKKLFDIQYDFDPPYCTLYNMILTHPTVQYDIDPPYFTV